MLLAECSAAVVMRLGHRVTDVSRADRFRVEQIKAPFGAASLVLATGGERLEDGGHRTVVLIWPPGSDCA